MHPYSIDTNEREKIFVCIFIVSIVVYEYLYNMLNNISLLSNLSFGWSLIIQIPSMPVVFYVIYNIFDKYAWKWKIFRKDLYLIKPIIQTPILEGNWEGNYYSKRKCINTNETIITEGETSFIIEQSWTKIRIIQNSETSTSCSEAAHLSFDEKMGIVLRYQYLNESNAKGADTMNSHIGFNKLRYLPELQTLEGDYFTDKNRQTYGYLKYRRK